MSEPTDNTLPLSLAMRWSLSSHDVTSPLTPEEMRTLAAEMEGALVMNECNFSHPDWRYVDGLRASAAAAHRDNGRLTDSELLDALETLRAENLFLSPILYGTIPAWTVSWPDEPAEGDPEATAREAIRAACIRHELMMERPRATAKPELIECDNCDGCGWHEGGAALKTHCEKCGGTGVIPAETAEPFGTTENAAEDTP